MGNQNSKPSEKNSPSSPVANHSSSLSTANSRRESKPSSGNRSHNAAPPSAEKTALLEKHSPPNNSSPSHQHRAPGSKKSMGNNHTKQSKTIPIPRNHQRGPDSSFEPSNVPRDPNYIPHSNLNFPPRLPLPIEEEVHVPGSPLLTPQEFSSSLHEDDVDGPIPRQSSAISSTTIEDDALGDELQPYPYETVPRRKVPTLLQWKQGGDRVYVTGTFTGWSRKFRMNRDPNTGFLSTVLQLPPGTHHVKFIIDGEMQLSNELPTAVDYTNILVNYVEVSADDIPIEDEAESKTPEGMCPPQVLRQGTEAQDHAPDSVGKTQPLEVEPKKEPTFWGKEVPKFLRDIDLAENARRYKRAARGIIEFPTPPGLPLFLGKSILNGTTPMKDDNSVLNMPNHTVLNHLATSSIKHDVLATSITTRYKRKYVTTIVYKPTEPLD